MRGGLDVMRLPRWVVAAGALVVVPGLLFSSVTLGLRVPAVGHPDAALPVGLDYSRGALPGIAPLRASFIQDVLGGVLGKAVARPAAPAGLSATAVASAQAATAVAAPGAPVDVTHELTNDDFEDAYRVRSVPFTARTSTRTATRERGEPSSCGLVGERTAWYRFRAPADVGLIADTFGTDHAVSLTVFTGKRMGALERVGCSTHPRGNAHVPFPAVAGTTYHFQVSSVSGGELVFGLRRQGVTERLLRRGFVAAIGGPSNDGRYWVFSAIDRRGATGDACAGVTIGMPWLPGACRIQTYVLDRRTGKSVLVSVASDGTPANDMSWIGTVSAGGRYVAFTSWATNLVPGDRNTCYAYVVPGQCPDAFVHDRDADGNGVFDETFPGARKTIRVSVSSTGAEGNDWSGSIGSISRDGRFIPFQSEASNLVDGDTNGVGDGFVHDRDADGNGVFDEPVPGATRTIRVSVSSTGQQAENPPAVPDAEDTIERRQYHPLERGNQILGMSSNGRYAVFRSPASNLVEGDTNGVYDVFLRDIRAGTTTRVNVSSRGEQADKATRLHNDFARPVSDDGRYVIFVSDATNLVPNDRNGAEDLFQRDLVTGTTRRLTVDWRGREVTEPPAPGQDVVFGGIITATAVLAFSADIYTLSELNHAMSANGRYVFFSSGAQLVPQDQDEHRDIYVRDLRWGTIALVSVSTSGEKGNASSNLPWPSLDGRAVAFFSSASNLDERREREEHLDTAGVVFTVYARLLRGGP